MLKSHICRGALALFLLLVPALAAQQEVRFEAVMTGRAVFGCMILPITYSVVQWVSPNQSQTGLTNDVRSVTSASGLPVYALRDGDIVTIEPNGTHTLILAGSFHALTVTPGGRFFALSGSNLSVITSAGVVEATYPLPGLSAPDLIAVASDECTIYYRRGSAIGRFNGCTGAALSDFMAIDPWDLFDIYPLPNGQVLVAKGLTVDLHDASGTLIRTVASVVDYGFEALVYVPYQIATTPDGQVLWMAILQGCEEMGSLVRVDMRDGRELSRVDAEMSTANGLVIGNATTAGIPTTSNVALLALTIALAFSALFLLRR